MILNILLYILLGIFLLPSIINFITVLFSLKNEEEYKNIFPRVSVVICSWDDDSVIERCILNYLQQAYPKDNYEIIIVDNGSRDNTKQICDNYVKQGKIKYVKLPTHVKKAEAIDFAIKNYSTGEIIIETDVDAVVKPDFIASMVKPYSKQEIGACTGVVLSGNWYLNFLSMIRAIEDFWWFAATMYGRYKLTNQGFLYGGCKSYRRTVWEDVGGHPTKTLVEDAEFAAAIINKGYKIAITKASPVLQEEVSTWNLYLKEQRRWIAGNLHVAKEYHNEISSHLFHQIVLYSNFSSDAIFLLPLFFVPFNPLFITVPLINLLALWIGFAAFNAKPVFYFYSVFYVVAGPFLHLTIGLDLLRHKITGKEIEWLKIHHYPIELKTPQIATLSETK